MRDTEPNAIASINNAAADKKEESTPKHRHCPVESEDSTPATAQDPTLALARVLEEWLRPHSPLRTSTELLCAIANKLDETFTSSKIPCPTLLSIKDAARVLALSERFLRGRIARGAWPSYRAGRAVRVDPLELRSYMAKPARRGRL